MYELFANFNCVFFFEFSIDILNGKSYFLLVAVRLVMFDQFLLFACAGTN